VSDIHRVAMLELALADEPQMFIDTRELKNDQISYTINTLRSLQQDYPEEQLALILGWDAFSKFDQWHEWQAFLQMSSLIILPRDTQNATPLNPTLSALLKQHQTTQHKIYLAKMPMVDISSTQLREKLAEHQDITAELPPAIAQYIKQHHLYQMEFNLLDTHRSRLADVD
jgi:nicotinate-nucleotide adenylyltransferase